jgi:adhesin/invasin
MFTDARGFAAGGKTGAAHTLGEALQPSPVLSPLSLFNLFNSFNSFNLFGSSSSLRLLLPFALALFCRAQSWATATLTPADASLSADTAGGTYTPLTGPVLNEGAISDVSTGSIVFLVPAGFRFDPAATVTATVTRLSGTKNPITLSSNIAVTATNITTTVTKADDTTGGGATSRITWSGLTVRPTAGTPLASGNITKSGTATIAGVNGSTSFGALTEIPGAAVRICVTLPNQTFTPGSGNSGPVVSQTAGTSFNISKLTATDQFTNIATSYSGARTISYTGPGTSPNGSAPTYTTPVNFTNGQSSNVLATTLKKAETTTIAATDGSLTAVPSSALTITVGTATQVRVETAANGNGVVVPAESISSGSSLTNYSIARDACGNFVTNIAADVGGWTLLAKTGGVVNGDLAAAADRKSATFTGHLTGTATIDAASGSLSRTDSGTQTVVPGAVSASSSTVSASPNNNVTADGNAASTITVTVKDANNNPIPGQTVVLSVTGTGNSVSTPPVTDANGQTTATLASTTAETKTVHANVGATSITQQPTVTFVPGPVSAANSTVTANPTNNLTADGTASSTITVGLKDANNNAVSGQTVTLSVSGTGNSLSSPALTDTNGLTTAQLLSAKAETKIVTASVGATIITQHSAVTFVAGTVNGSLSTVAANPTNNLTADGSASSTISVTLKDANNNPISGQMVTFSVTGTGNLCASPGLTDTNGQVAAVLKSTRAETKTITATAGATTLSPQPLVTFVPGPVNATNSTVTASPSTNVTADGTAFSTITVTVKDATGNALAGQNVTLTVSGIGNSLSSPAPTDTNGQTTARLSSARAETKTVTARVGTTTITPSATVIFVPGSVNESLSTVTVSPSGNVTADGAAFTTITVTLRDPNYNLISGQTVTLSVSGSSNIVSTPPPTGANGQTTATLRSTKAQTKTVTASVGATTISDQPTVTFTPGPMDHYLVTASPTQLSGSAFDVNVKAVDLYNNCVTTDSSTVVTLSNTGSAQFDSNGNGVFGEQNDNHQTLANGAFTIHARDQVLEAIVIAATDPNAKTGTSSTITIVSGQVVIHQLLPQGDGSMKLLASGGPGLTNRVQAASAIGGPASWTTIGTVVADPDGLINFTDTDAPQHSARYYRIATP